MPHDPIARAEQALSQLAERFEHWRQSRANRHERIPQPLWDEAIALSRVLPDSRVTKRLRLSQTDLKKRRLAQSPSPAMKSAEPPATFIELPALGAASAPLNAPMLVEFERPDGARLRLRYDQALPLTTLMQAFLEPR